MTELSILNSKGDTKITWDASDPAKCEEARKTIADLAKLGYSFFLTDNRPADAVTAGDGELIVRKITAGELIESTEPPSEETPPVETPATDEPKFKKQKGRKVVAVRQMSGG